MSNYFEWKDTIVFHPGYDIEEIINELGVTQEDFAKCLDTTPKNLSLIIRGEQRLSVDIAMKLSRMFGMSVESWLNMQRRYDAAIAEINSEKELELEKPVFKSLDYKYFRDNFGLPDLKRKINEQIEEVRHFLRVSTLCVFTKEDLTVDFRGAHDELSEEDIIRANVMVQIAINKALKVEAPKFNRAKFKKAIEYALTLTKNHDDFYTLIRDAFLEAGVVFVIVPSLPGAKISGATKKIKSNVMLMVSDKYLFSDIFWFALLHESAHVVKGDYGITFEEINLSAEKEAAEYAANKLVPPGEYKEFLAAKKFDSGAIVGFAEKIDRDPSVVFGRLQVEENIKFDAWALTKMFKQGYTLNTKKESEEN